MMDREKMYLDLLAKDAEIAALRRERDEAVAVIADLESDLAEALGALVESNDFNLGAVKSAVTVLTKHGEL